MTDEELEAIEARCGAATPGPWYPHATDDELYAGALYVGIQPGRDGGLFRHDNRCGLAAGHRQQVPSGQIVAITMLQNPHLADVDDSLWDENTVFIAHAREDIPLLVAEVRRLRTLVGE